MRDLKNHIFINSKSYAELDELDKEKFKNMCIHLKDVKNLLKKNDSIDFSTNSKRNPNDISPNFPDELYPKFIEAFRLNFG